MKNMALNLALKVQTEFEQGGEKEGRALEAGSMA